MVRDSAGIRIVESRGPGRWSAGEAWTAAEAVSIGVVDGPEEYTFGRIRQVAALPDGGIAVLDDTDLVIKVFDANGRHRRTFGGKAAGRRSSRGYRGSRCVAIPSSSTTGGSPSSRSPRRTGS